MLAFDGHRSDDLTTYLFKSTDYGETWKPLKGDLPPATPVRVIREDVKNPDLLFAGTESAAYASIDAGAHWVRLMNHMPTVAGGRSDCASALTPDLIAATHGRSFWVMDISPLQELTPAVLSLDTHLFTVKLAIAFDYRVFTNDEFLADKRFIGENAPIGTAISYYLKSAPSGDVKLAILDKGGAVVRELYGGWRAKNQSRAAGSAREAAGAIGRCREQAAADAVTARAAPGTAPGAGGGRTACQPLPRGGGGGRGGPTAAAGRPRRVRRPPHRKRPRVHHSWFTSIPTPEVKTIERGTSRRAALSIIGATMALQAKTEPANTRADSLDTQLYSLLRAGLDAALPIKDALAAAIKQFGDGENRNGADQPLRSGQLFGQISGSPFLPTVTQREEL